jgi:flagellar motor switch protein FliG
MGKRKSGIDIYKAASSVEKDGFYKVTSGKGEARAAGLMLLLGTDEAARVMARLDPDEAETLARQIAATSRVDAVEARKILDEFGDRFGNLEIKRARGGVEAAREILNAAFGEEKASKILSRAVPEAAPGPFAFLNDLSFNQIAGLLRKENIITLSLVMSYLDPAQASRLLESLPESQRGAIVLRMARTEKVSREVIAAAENTLQEKLRRIGKDESEEMDGRSALADILRYMDLSDERRLLENLEDSDPSLAEQVKEKLYTMDSVLHLRDRDLQNILLPMKEKDIALLLKGQTSEIRERINGSLSSRRRLLVADEGDIMGAVPRSEADAAVKAFLEEIRKGEDEGSYIIIREEDLI